MGENTSAMIDGIGVRYEIVDLDWNLVKVIEHASGGSGRRPVGDEIFRGDYLAALKFVTAQIEKSTE
jgi:hypothetical protein